MVQQKRWRTRGDPPCLNTVDTQGRDKIISAEKSTKILGCNIPNDLNWKQHLISGNKPLLKDLRKKTGALKHLGKQLPQRSRLILATGLIRSRVAYLIAVWGGTTTNHIKKIQAVVNTAARFISGMNRRTRDDNPDEGLQLAKCARACQIPHCPSNVECHPQEEHPLSIYRKITVNTDDWTLTTKLPRILTTQAGFRARGVRQWNELDSGGKMSGPPSFLQEEAQGMDPIASRMDPG